MTSKRTRKPDDVSEDNESDDKGGNGSPPPSLIIVTFPAPGIGDPTRVDRQNATHGQAVIAGFYLLGGALWELFQMLGQQAARQMQDQAAMQSILKGGKRSN